MPGADGGGKSATPASTTQRWRSDTPGSVRAHTALAILAAVRIDRTPIRGLMPAIPADQLRDYLHALVPERPPELQAMEAYALETDFPIIGPAAGQLCYLISRILAARQVFELGSGYGYSTAWFARAVHENGGGTVHHVVWDEDLSNQARRHLSALGYDDVVRYHVGEAVATLQQTAGPFDVIFNDIDKHAYPASLPVIAQKLRRGGVLIIDNMLWSGRIFDASDTSRATQGVREFTRLITADPAWIVSLVPIRDGLIVAYRK
jgi:caffeoyl-CoA O-methyltransferase